MKEEKQRLTELNRENERRNKEKKEEQERRKRAEKINEGKAEGQMNHKKTPSTIRLHIRTPLKPR